MVNLYIRLNQEKLSQIGNKAKIYEHNGLFQNNICILVILRDIINRFRIIIQN